jgi:regulator of sigma E protease
VSLAVLNILPLPILDGGQGLLYTIEAIIRRPLPDMIRAGIAYVSWGLMLVIFGYLTFKDAIALFWN